MKTKFKNFRFGLVILFLTLLSVSSYSQCPGSGANVTIAVGNFSTPTASSFEFDVYITNTTDAAIKLGSMQGSLIYNSGMSTAGTFTIVNQPPASDFPTLSNFGSVAHTTASRQLRWTHANNGTGDANAVTLPKDVRMKLGRFRYTTTNPATFPVGYVATLTPSVFQAAGVTHFNPLAFCGGAPTSFAMQNGFSPTQNGYLTFSPSSYTVTLNPATCPTAAAAGNLVAESPCAGTTNGSAVITLTGAPSPTATISYKVDNGAVVSNVVMNNSAFTVSGLSAGSHTVTVTYPGCSDITTSGFTIDAGTPLTTDGSVTTTECDSYTWPANGVTYTTSQTGLTHTDGCNTATLNLTIINSTSNTTSATACDSYVWAAPLGNGQTYTSSQNGITHTSVNAAGCTHTETLNLTINNSTSNTTVATACDSYVWAAPLGNGQTYTSSQNGITHTSVNAAGCTHTETLNLTINSSTSHTTNATATACEAYVWEAPLGNGQTYTSPQTGITHTSVNAAGCTHTETLNLSFTSQALWYLDADNDGYYTGSAVSSCASPGAGYTTSFTGSGDCNDNNSDVNPGAAEICYNNIDDNCNLTLSEGCTPVVVNMTTSYHNMALPSMSTAVPAVAYSYGGFTNLKYRFTVTNTTTGTTAPDVIQTSRYITIPASIHSYNASYTIRVSAVINEEIVPFAGNIITVHSPSVQLVTLSTASCGATLASLSSTLTANAGLNATGYTFRIRLNDANPTPAYAFSQSATRFVGANSFTGFPLQYGSSYKVAVQYTFTDPVTGLPVQSGYGAECTVNTPSIPVTSIASPACNSTVASLSAPVSAAAASYATGYQFRIRLFSDNGSSPTYYTTAVSTSRFSSLSAFQGITLAYSTEYAISVRYSILNGSTTVWSNYGSECKVTTPFFPTTSLVPSQCGTGNPTALNQQLNITPYPGNPNYRVLLEELTGEDVTNSQELVVTVPNFRLNQFSIAQDGKNYSISVAIKLGGVFGDYSTACDVFTAANGSGNDGGGTIVKTTLPFKATAYPNPFANSFMLDIKTSSQASVNVKVYDMIGRIVEQKEVRVSDLESTTIGSQYPSGVYNVVVSQDGNVQTVRVVKR